MEELINSHPAIRYVAVLKGKDLIMKSRAGLENKSSSDSDRFEELVVNPTLLKLVQQRGDIDCGGMQYVIIRYGNFYQWVTPIKDGHVSIGLELSMKKDEIEPLIDSWIRKLSR
jgi:hypothetical protein